MGKDTATHSPQGRGERGLYRQVRTPVPLFLEMHIELEMDIPSQKEPHKQLELTKKYMLKEVDALGKRVESKPQKRILGMVCDRGFAQSV